MDFMHIGGQKEAIWNDFFSINWFVHGVSKIKFKHFQGLKD